VRRAEEAGATLIAARRQLIASALLAVALLVLPAGAAAGERFFADPIIEGPAHLYPPAQGFDSPCGLAVDSGQELYVADYFRDVVDIFSPQREYKTQLKAVDPEDGPCGLAVGPAGDLYVNDFHRSVIRYPKGPATFGAGVTIDSDQPTGVAVDPESGDVYVDDRAYVAVYSPSGAPVEVGGQPLRIGEGTLGSGYGVAVSAGADRVYVADAADETIKVYDPAVSPVSPIATIDGQATPPGRFVSLRDAAIALDHASGDLYVVDDLQPEFFERPEAAVYGFSADGSYLGRMPDDIVDALPAGLAVDNSGKSSQGTVYVTSGNGEGAFVWSFQPSELGSAASPASAASAASATSPVATASPASTAATSVAAAALPAPDVGAAAAPAPQAGVLRPRARARRHRLRHHHTALRHRRGGGRR